MCNSYVKKTPFIFSQELSYCLAWLPFFLSPFLSSVNTPLLYLSATTLFFATGLFAAAWIWNAPTKPQLNTVDIFPYVFLFLCITPTFALLILNELRSPWHAFQGTLYLIAAWLVYQMSKEKARHIIASKYFLIIITSAAYLYILFSLLQAWDMRFFVGDRLFTFWTSQVASFPGPLMQQNLEGLFLTLTTTIILFHAAKQKEIFLFIVSVMPIMGVFLTNSRSSILLLILISGLFLFIHRKERFFILALISSIAAALFLTVIINSIGIVGADQREVNPFNRFATGNLSQRIAIWLMAIQLAYHHPLFGIGWMNMPAYSVDASLIVLQNHPNLETAISDISTGGNMWAHNIILQFAMCAGFLGLSAIGMITLYLLMQLRNIFDGLYKNQASSLGILLALIIFLHGIVSVSIMSPFFMVLFAFFLASGTVR